MTQAILDNSYMKNMLSPLVSGTFGLSVAAHGHKNAIQKQLNTMTAVSTTEIGLKKEETLDAVFLEILTNISEISRYITTEVKMNIVRRLQVLLNSEDWEMDDNLPSPASFRTFLKLLVSLNSSKQPGLAIAPSGNFVAGWNDGKDQIFIETVKNDLMRWVLSRTIEGQKERASGESKIQRFFEVTQAWNPKGFVSNATNCNR